MSQNPDSRSTPPRFLEVAKKACEDGNVDASVLTARAAELQQQMLKDYWFGITELGLEPDAAERRALELFHPPSAVKQFKEPADVRLLFSDRCRLMRYFLMMLGAVGMVDSFRSAAFKSGREVHWVQWVTDVGRWVISYIGGLCLLTEILEFLGLRQKARALYMQTSQLLLGTLGRIGGQSAVPIGLALLLIALFLQHGGFQPARDAERFVAVDSSRSDRKTSDGTAVAGDTTAGSSTTPVESRTPSSVSEPEADGGFNGIATFGVPAGLGIVPAGGMLADGVADSPPVHDMVAPPIKEGFQKLNGAPGSSHNSGAISRGPHAGDLVRGISPTATLPSLVASGSEQAAPKGSQKPARPSPPRNLMLVVGK